MFLYSLLTHSRRVDSIDFVDSGWANGLFSADIYTDLISAFESSS